MSSFVKYLKPVTLLALPLILTNIGIIFSTVVNTIMVAHYSTQALTFRSASVMVYIFVITIIAGFVQGIGVSVANSYGEKNYLNCGNIVRKSLWPLLLVATVAFLIHWYGLPILRILNEPLKVAEGAVKSLHVLAFSFFPCVRYFALAYMLEGIKKPHIVTFAVIIGNIVNAFLGWIFIFGKFGMTHFMGAAGASLATTLSIVVSWLILEIYVCFFMKERRRFFAPLKFKIINKQRFIYIGLGIAIILGVEEFAVTTNVVFSGWISPLALASYSLILNIYMIILTISMGLASSTGTWSGIYNGAKNCLGIWGSTKAGLFLHFVTSAFLTILFFTTYKSILGFYTNDPAVLKMTLSAIMLLGWIILADGAQIILSNALRGAKKIVGVTSIQAACSLLISIPTSYCLAFHLHMGIKGLLKGMLIGSCSSFIGLSIVYWFTILKKKNI